MTDRIDCSWRPCDRNAQATVRTFGGGRYPTCLRCVGSVARAVSLGNSAMLRFNDPAMPAVYVKVHDEAAA